MNETNKKVRAMTGPKKNTSKLLCFNSDDDDKCCLLIITLVKLTKQFGPSTKKNLKRNKLTKRPLIGKVIKLFNDPCRFWFALFYLHTEIRNESSHTRITQTVVVTMIMCIDNCVNYSITIIIFQMSWILYARLLILILINFYKWMNAIGQQVRCIHKINKFKSNNHITNCVWIKIENVTRLDLLTFRVCVSIIVCAFQWH